MSYCMCKLLTTNGFRNWAYWIAFSNGKPFEWNDTKQSHTGQFSTGSWNQWKKNYEKIDSQNWAEGMNGLTFSITSSSKTTIRMYSNSRSRVRISFIGFDWVFLAIAHIPTTTCLPEFDDALQSESTPSFESPPHKSMSPYRIWRKCKRRKLVENDFATLLSNEWMNFSVDIFNITKLEWKKKKKFYGERKSIFRNDVH